MKHFFSVGRVEKFHSRLDADENPKGVAEGKFVGIEVIHESAWLCNAREWAISWDVTG